MCIEHKIDEADEAFVASLTEQERALLASDYDTLDYDQQDRWRAIHRAWENVTIQLGDEDE